MKISRVSENSRSVLVIDSESNNDGGDSGGGGHGRAGAWRGWGEAKIAAKEAGRQMRQLRWRRR